MLVLMLNGRKSLNKFYIKYNDNLVVIPIDSSKAYLNGKSTSMQTKAKIINNKTMIPLRFVTTALGFNIEWNKTTRVANIVTKAEITTTAATTITTTTTTTEATTETTTKAVETTTQPTTTAVTTTTTSTQNNNSNINVNYEDNFGFDNNNGRFYIKDLENKINIDDFVHYDDYYNLSYALVLNGN